jgi:hypothetical protein
MKSNHIKSQTDVPCIPDLTNVKLQETETLTELNFNTILICDPNQMTVLFSFL